MSKIIVKVIQYKLVKGTDEKSFLSASNKLMPKLAKLSGFIKRELLKDESGIWLDIVYWKSMKQARESEEKITAISECMKCINMMDSSSMKVMLFEQIQNYE